MVLGLLRLKLLLLLRLENMKLESSENVYVDVVLYFDNLLCI